MKINSITNQNIFHSREKIHSTNERREHAIVKNNNENNQINTTIKTNSDGRVNFKGGVPTPLLHKIASFTMDNALIAEAIFALFITCGLRPITILATAKNDEDKAKCEYQAVKSISSGIVGLGTTAFVAAPIHRATKLVAENKKLEQKGIEVLTKIAEDTQDTELSSKIKTVVKDGKFDPQALKEHGAYILKRVKTEAKDSYDDVFNAFSYKKALDGKVDIIKTPGKAIQDSLDNSVKNGIETLKEVIETAKTTGAGDGILDQLKLLLLDSDFNGQKIKDLVKDKAQMKTIKENIEQITSKEKAEVVLEGIKAKFKTLNYTGTAKNVVDKLYQPVFMPIRAALTIALVPIFLGVLGKKKPASNKQKTQQQAQQQAQAQKPINNTTTFKNTPKPNTNNVFAEFDRNNNTQQNNPTFKGITDFAVKPLTKISGEVANSNFFKKWISKFSASPKSFTHLMVLDSVILSTFYTINSLRNKKIEKEQKPQMVINDMLTLGVSAAGSYLLDDVISNKVTKLGEKFIKGAKVTVEENGVKTKVPAYKTLGREALEKLGDNSPVKSLMTKVDGLLDKKGDALKSGIDEVVEMFKLEMAPIVNDDKAQNAFINTKDALEDHSKELAKKVKGLVESANNPENRDKLVAFVKEHFEDVQARAKADNFLAGLNKLKVLVVFGMIYRYLGPVLITPIANKLSDKLFGKDKNDKKANATTATTKQEVAQPVQQMQVKEAVKPENLLDKHLKLKSTTA